MPKRWLAGQGPLRTKQLEFIRRLERGDATAEQLLAELKISGTVFGQWLQKPVFVRRYERALKQVQARLASVEATAQLRRARKKLLDDGETPAEAPALEPPVIADSPLSRRLLELHGSTDAIEKKSVNLSGDAQ